MSVEFDFEFDFEFIKGQLHYQSGKQKEEIPNSTSVARAGFEAEKFQHLKKINKASTN